MTLKAKKLSRLQESGIRVTIDSSGKIHLTGTPNLKEKATDFVKQHYAEIVSELRDRLKNTPMTKCLHGLECIFLESAEWETVCTSANQSIFSLKDCPEGLWWIDPEPFKYATPERLEVSPGACENCPASGTWNWGDYKRQGLLCFHNAYYLGKPGKPKLCRVVRSRCLKGEEKD